MREWEQVVHSGGNEDHWALFFTMKLDRSLFSPLTDLVFSPTKQVGQFLFYKSPADQKLSYAAKKY